MVLSTILNHIISNLKRSTMAQNRGSKHSEKIKFIMLLGRSLHRYGASSDRIEKALELVSSNLGIKADFFSIPTSITASFKIDNEREETRMERLSPGKVNLSKLRHVDQTVDYVVEDKMTITEGTELIQLILHKKPLYNNFLVTLSYGLISCGVSIFLNGNWVDAFSSFILGLIVGLFSETVKEERIDSIREGIIAFFITIIALLSTLISPHLNTNIVTLSSLIVLIPGLMLTTSMGELASQNLTSGTARLTGSFIILLKISFGVYIATQTAMYLGVSPQTSAITNYSIFVVIPMLIIVALGLSFTFQARKSDIPWIILAAMLSYFSSRFFSQISSEAAGPFLSGTVIAAASNLFSRSLKRPAMIFLLPAIILLVPGSIGFKGINLVFNKDLLAGVDSIFSMALIGISLVSGTYFGSLLVKPRRTL